MCNSGIKHWSESTRQLSVIKTKSSWARDCRSEGREKCQVPEVLSLEQRCSKRDWNPSLFISPVLNTLLKLKSGLPWSGCDRTASHSCKVFALNSSSLCFFSSNWQPAGMTPSKAKLSKLLDTFPKGLLLSASQSHKIPHVFSEIIWQ